MFLKIKSFVVEKSAQIIALPFVAKFLSYCHGVPFFVGVGVGYFCQPEIKFVIDLSADIVKLVIKFLTTLIA